MMLSSSSEVDNAQRTTLSQAELLLTEHDLRTAVSPVKSSGGGLGLAVIAIGGATGAFRMSSLLLRLHLGSKKNVKGSNSCATFRMPSWDDEVPSPIITFDVLIEAIHEYIVGPSDADIAAFGFPQPEMLGPKVCLVLSVMKFFGIPSFQYFPTVGSTLGIAEASV